MGIRKLPPFVEREGQVIVGLAIVRLQIDGLLPFDGGRVILAFARQFSGHIAEAVELGGGRIHGHQAVWRHVDEFGDVHAAIWGCGIFDQNSWAVAALFVDVREEELGVERTAFRGERQPAAGLARHPGSR
jgi:hypothetical protein